MKQTRIERVYDILLIILNHLPVMAVAVTIMGIVGRKDPKVLLWALLVMIPLVFYAMRETVNQRLLFYATHALILFGIIFIPLETMKKVLMIAIVIYYLVWSIYLKTKSNTGRCRLIPPVAFILMTIGLQIFCSRLGKLDWSQYYLVFTLCYFSGYFFCHYLENYISFVDAYKKSVANLPTKSIFKTGIKQIWGIFLSGTILLAVTINLGLFTQVDEWMSGMWPSRSNSVIYEPQEPDQEEQSVNKPYVNGMPANKEKKELSKPMKLVQFIVEKLVTAITVGVVSIAAFALAYCIYRFVKDNFSIKEKTEEIVIAENGDVREKCYVVKENKKEEKRFLFFNRRAKVRKIFKANVLKSKNILGSDMQHFTAKECCERLDRKALSRVYDKARYSNEEITTEDLRVARQESI